jgi:hypothetical protein
MGAVAWTMLAVSVLVAIGPTGSITALAGLSASGTGVAVGCADGAGPSP